MRRYASKKTPRRALVEFSDWTHGRATAHLSTNSFSEELAFQGWRNFKEAFAPELVHKAIEETSKALGRPVKSCADPFGGSGTTALTCQFLGVRTTTIEVNPFLSDLIESKLSQYDISSIAKSLKMVLAVPRRRLTRATLLQGVERWPPSFVQPGIKGRYIFSREFAAGYAQLFSRINRVRDSDVRRLFKVLLVSTAVRLSNIVVSGKGRRYKTNWEDSISKCVDLRNQFETAALAAVYDIERYAGRKSLQFKLLRGDSRELVSKVPKIDVAVLSPPYPNSFDYTDVYNVELWIGGYLRNSKDNRTLRVSTLRSHVQVKREYSNKVDGSKTLSKAIHLLHQRVDKLWSRSIPDMVESYFVDMVDVLRGLSRKLNDGGRIYLVVGNSMYAGVEIDVARILSELAVDLKLKTHAIEPFRSMRSSPQQGGRSELTESLVVLSR